MKLENVNMRRVGGGLARVGLWATSGIVVFKIGGGIKEFGQELMKGTLPGFILAGVVFVGVGEIVQMTTIVPGVCAFSAGLDVVGGIKEGRDETA